MDLRYMCVCICIHTYIYNTIERETKKNKTFLWNGTYCYYNTNLAFNK